MNFLSCMQQRRKEQIYFSLQIQGEWLKIMTKCDFKRFLFIECHSADFCKGFFHWNHFWRWWGCSTAHMNKKKLYMWWRTKIILPLPPAFVNLWLWLLSWPNKMKYCREKGMGVLCETYPVPSPSPWWIPLPWTWPLQFIFLLSLMLFSILL